MKQAKGPGFGNAMIISVQKNARMLRGIGYFDRRKEYGKAAKKVPIEDYNTSTPEQLKELRIIYTEAKRQAVIKKLIVLIPAILFTVVLGYGFTFWMKMVFGF